MTDDTRASLARLEESVGSLHEKVDDIKHVTTERLNGHSKRVRSLELTRSRCKGYLAATGGLFALAGAALAYFRDHFKL